LLSELVDVFLGELVCRLRLALSWCVREVLLDVERAIGLVLAHRLVAVRLVVLARDVALLVHLVEIVAVTALLGTLLVRLLDLQLVGQAVHLKL
jgi:hypothetical protein